MIRDSLHARLHFTAIAVLAMAGAASSPAGAETFHWLQYVPNGLEVRAVTTHSQCPATVVDGTARPMTVRAAPGDQYAVTTCSAVVPAAAKSVTIDGTPVALPAKEMKRIAVIGDTGCRLKGSYIQACNDPVQWPFRLIAEMVAQAKPDLVIHVGDYHYRESACPPGNAGCAGTPFGDTWDVWRADFFDPAATLLKAAPWVFVRGNHEECDRGGKGWSRTLDPYPFDAAKGCNGTGLPFTVPLPDVTLAVFDVIHSNENKVSEDQKLMFQEHYKTLSSVNKGPVWMLQHKPIWGPGGMVAGMLFGDNKTLAAAATGNIPATVTAMLSGHHHIFQVLTYEQDLPLQIVSGHGGDYLNDGSLTNPAGWVVNGVKVKAGVHLPAVFGYAMLDKAPSGWALTSFDRFGKALVACDMAGRSATCLTK
jgi:hypothetical protein